MNIWPIRLLICKPPPARRTERQAIQDEIGLSDPGPGERIVLGEELTPAQQMLVDIAR
jgi:hypothetical protein